MKWVERGVRQVLITDIPHARYKHKRRQTRKSIGPPLGFRRDSGSNIISKRSMLTATFRSPPEPPSSLRVCASRANTKHQRRLGSRLVLSYTGAYEYCTCTFE
eukprot:scaffold52783_cov50-Prasinocladus_malaysianus.AAC.2